MYVILQLQHSVGDVSNSTSSTVQSLTELVLFFFYLKLLGSQSFHPSQCNLNVRARFYVEWLEVFFIICKSIVVATPLQL